MCDYEMTASSETQIASILQQVGNRTFPNYVQIVHPVFSLLIIRNLRQKFLVLNIMKQKQFLFFRKLLLKLQMKQGLHALCSALMAIAWQLLFST